MEFIELKSIQSKHAGSVNTFLIKLEGVRSVELIETPLETKASKSQSKAGYTMVTMTFKDGTWERLNLDNKNLNKLKRALGVSYTDKRMKKA